MSKCIAITNFNEQCTRNHISGSNYCWQHLQIYENKESELLTQMSNMNLDDIDMINDNFNNMNIRNDTNMIPDLENIVSEYTDFDTYLTLIEYDLKTYNIKKYLKQHDITILEAIDHNLIDLVKSLISKNTLKPHEYFYLDYSIKKSNFEIFEYFVSIGLPVTQTSFLLSAENCSVKIFKYIIEHSNLNKKDNFFVFAQALKLAIKYNCVATVNYIVNDIGLKIKNNLNAYLKVAKNKEIIKILKSKK
jgi:hypothetical protein